MPTKPTDYPDWTDGAVSKVQRPSAAQITAGWSPGQAPPAQTFNWLQWLAGLWIRYLDDKLNAVQPNSQTISNLRLIGGGNWSFGAGSGTLAWSAPFQVAVPGLADSANQAAASSVVLTDGQVAYVGLNMPFVTQGNTTTGSNQVTNLAYTGTIATGQTVSGSGIQAGTTVTALSGNTVTLSQNATATATGVSVTFGGAAALTVNVADEATFQPQANSLIIARRVGATVIVGTGSGEQLLRDAEWAPLRGVGYMAVTSAPAGATMASGTPVYMSLGASDGGRTAGAYYPVDVSVANSQARARMVGVVMSAVTAGATAQVISGGYLNTYAGLTPGAVYYADPATPGGITTTRPTTAGQAAVAVGTAVSATTMLLNASGAATNVTIASGAAQGNYGVASEAQLVSAIAAAQSAGGGIIVITQALTLTTAYTIPTGTSLVGTLGQGIVTINPGASITLAGSARIKELWMQSGSGFGSSASMVTLSGNYNYLQDCRFIANPLATMTCITVASSGNNIRNCQFVGVAASATAVGIYYTTGYSDNSDDNSLFS